MGALYWSLKVTPKNVGKLNLAREQVNKTPSGEIFVKPSLQKVYFIYINFLSYIQGLVPEILEGLITARKRAKADLKVNEISTLKKHLQSQI